MVRKPDFHSGNVSSILASVTINMLVGVKMTFDFFIKNCPNSKDYVELIANDKRVMHNDCEYVRCILGGYWANLHDDIVIDLYKGSYELNIKNAYTYNNGTMVSELDSDTDVFIYVFDVTKEDYDWWLSS